MKNVAKFTIICLVISIFTNCTFTIGNDDDSSDDGVKIWSVIAVKNLTTTRKIEVVEIINTETDKIETLKTNNTILPNEDTLEYILTESGTYRVSFIVDDGAVIVDPISFNARKGKSYIISLQSNGSLSFLEG